MSGTKGRPTNATPTTGVPRRQLGRYLRDMRQAYGMSIRNAAKAIGVGDGTLQRLETGAASVIHDDHLEALCELYEHRAMLPALKALAAQGKSPTGGTSTATSSKRPSICTWVSKRRPRICASIGRT